MRNPHGNNEPERQELATPRWLVGRINEIALTRWASRLKLDVCAHKENAVCPAYFSEADDGLNRPWGEGPVFCNPPFRATAKWLAKAMSEVKTTPTLMAVFLLRGADLQTQWVRDYHRYFEIFLLTPRVNYWNWREDRIEKGASFPSMLWLTDMQTRRFKRGLNRLAIDLLDLRA